MNENDKKAAARLEEVYKVYFGLADARMNEDEESLRKGIFELGLKTVEWLDVVVKDIEDNVINA